MAINPHLCGWCNKKAPNGRKWPLYSLEGRVEPKPKMVRTAPESSDVAEQHNKKTAYLCDEHAKMAHDNTRKGGNRKAKFAKIEIPMFPDEPVAPRRSRGATASSGNDQIPDGYND